MLISSYSEGLPLVIFEAFNSKTPVITFDTIGSNELVKNDKTGIVVPAFDILKFEKAIVDLLTNRPKAERLSNEAYDILKSEFSLDRMTTDTVAFYNSCFT